MYEYVSIGCLCAIGNKFMLQISALEHARALIHVLGKHDPSFGALEKVKKLSSFFGYS